MSTIEISPSPPETKDKGVYNQVFWLSYLANVSLVTANALTFRFAELIAYLGGTERIAGSVVSTGFVGALLARLLLGQAIDRYGTRKLWMFASLFFVFGCSIFLMSQRIGLELYLARVVFAVGLAGMFTCSIVHIQNQVPAHRRTEIIATLGSSGFCGMILGTQLGDWMFRLFPAGRPQFVALFGTAMGLGVLYFLLVLYLTRKDVHERPQETPAAHRLILRYWPGPVVWVAIMMGVGVTVTTVFLTRFATQLELRGIGTFFTAYATSAFLFRVVSRGWSQTIGRHRMILLGLGGHFIGFLILPSISREWHFLFPAACCGFGHALLFPAVVSLGAGAFPKAYRGTGTTIVLGFTEVGAMASAPPLGWIIDHFGFTPMFHTAAFVSLTIAVYYRFTAARVPDEEINWGTVVETSMNSAHTGTATDLRAPAEPAIAAREDVDRLEDELEAMRDDSLAIPCPQMGRNAP